MKLNYIRTICVGFAFFLICSFWQAYDNSIPILLISKYGMSQTVSGFIMAIDNILALFMLPFFGSLSDRTQTKMGRRTPFILGGTVVAVISFVLLPFPGRIVPFMLLLMISLLAMATFRSPAVALMPDVTMKPLRSKANAVINLMGSCGGILVLVLGIVFGTGKAAENLGVFKSYFFAVAVLMVIALIIFMLTVREPRFVDEMHAQSRAFGIEDEEAADDQASDGRAEDEEVDGQASGAWAADALGGSKDNGVGPKTVYKKGLDEAHRKSLIFILASIVLWFMGYNAVTSKYSVYATTILHKDFNLTLIIAQIAAILSYLPVGMIASKIGRKKTILAGVVMLAISFGIAGFLRAESPSVLMNCMFALAGIGWATINVNSFPMVVEMCSESDVGKYTGIYYTASMGAQIVTPVISGFLMDQLGMTVLFPYAFIFAAAAFFTMLAVHHGDSRPTAKKGIEALEDM